MTEELGYVYVLSNPSMPDIVKIGTSKHGGSSRSGSLFTTGVPSPFVLEFEIFSHDPCGLESQVHRKLEEYRVNQRREFFECSVAEAIEAIMHVFTWSYGLTLCDTYEMPAVKAVRTFAKNLGLDSYDLADAMHFLKDEQINEAMQSREEWLKDQAKKKVG